MKTAQRTKILVEGNPQLAATFAAQIEQRHPVRIEREPVKNLALTKARDSSSMQPFYLGEVLLTECTVSIGDTYGVGAVMGDNPDKAYELAVVDAAFRGKLPETAAWIEQLREEEKRIECKHLQEEAISMLTKVDFSTLEGLHDKN